MEVKALLKIVTAREDMTVGSNTDLSASGGSLQPARPRCCSILALPRKRCSAAGAAWDFLQWEWRAEEVGFMFRELIPQSPFLPSLPGAPYVRAKIFLEASRWVRLVQQPPDNAMKS